MIKINDYVIDCAVTEEHEYEADVTSYPVESGATITDNRRKRPATVTIEGVVSDTPIGPVATARQTEQAAPGAELNFLPSDEALSRLLAIHNSGEMVPVETSLRAYSNMLLTSLSIPRSAKTGKALRFTARFVEVIIVANERTVVRVASLGAGGKKKASGAGVVHVFNGPKQIVTANGYDAVWNPKKGRYEYMNKKTGAPSGNPVPNHDLTTGLQSAGQPGNLDPTNPAASPSAANNSTYFDQQSDEWRNTDGTSVTKEQLVGRGGNAPTQRDRDEAWWKANGLDGNLYEIGN